MRKRIAEFFRSDLGVLVLVAAARFVLHVATNGQYGFHRDELQTLDDARHLDWGFVAYPPITPLIGRFELILFGTSLIGFRVFSAIALSTGRQQVAAARTLPIAESAAASAPFEEGFPAVLIVSAVMTGPVCPWRPE